MAFWTVETGRYVFKNRWSISTQTESNYKTLIRICNKYYRGLKKIEDE